jgi:hypothetical protein
MLYIEQPVGTGYTQGTPSIENEDDLAEQFVGFLQQFLKVFPELRGKKTYLTGESVRLGSYSPWVMRTDTEYFWMLCSMQGCTFPVSPNSTAFGVFVDPPQISLIISTRMRLLICRSREFGSLTVRDAFYATLLYFNLCFL